MMIHTNKGLGDKDVDARLSEERGWGGRSGERTNERSLFANELIEH